ncbi:hypothetical protein EG68_05625 [Paragonimus skrjabini miyazakii]|uniref:Fas-binding factor 1 C-terminal domain-containing protein n=1 Tax=Paragonimus skrjabini miyazakii TaxID=59628 RepID=A0A8S9YWG6_9TREM|nr:hypothetical protein EG68_05625 [Paragonimus skrjabini miyazakii]
MYSLSLITGISDGDNKIPMSENKDDKKTDHKQPGTNKSKINSRKNVLDLLMEPYDQVSSFLPTEKTLNHTDRKTDNTVGEESRRSESTGIKRSVRFSETVSFDEGNINKTDRQPPNTEVVKRGQKSVEFQQRPHTAPGLSKDVKSSLENLLTDDLITGQLQTEARIHSADSNVQQLRARIHRPSSLDSFGTGMDELQFPIQKAHKKVPFIAASGEKSTDDVSGAMTTLRISEMEAKIKRLEMERTNANTMLDLLRKQHQEEIAVIELTSRSKLDLLEEGARSRETRLREELKFLEEQSRERLVLLEQQRDQLISELSTKLNEMRSQTAQEVTRLKMFHDQELAALKSTHEETITQIKMACQKETQVLGDLQPNAEALKRLLEQLTNTTTELNRTEQERLRELTIRQEQIVRREEAVRAVEERIVQREEELERERKQIVDAIAKLEFQMKENSKLMSEGHRK